MEQWRSVCAIAVIAISSGPPSLIPQRRDLLFLVLLPMLPLGLFFLLVHRNTNYDTN